MTLSAHPTFSLVHTTARVDGGWLPAYDAWAAACVNPADVEYILCIDAEDEGKYWTNVGLQLVVNHGPRSAVAGWNSAARASTGKFLIQVADDLRPCAEWDRAIRLVLIQHARKVLPARLGASVYPPLSEQVALKWALEQEIMLDVCYGDHVNCQPGFLYFSFLTRARYTKLGNLFWHEYDGMFGDDEETEKAYRDGVVVNARHLVFPHLHYSYGLSEEDEVYRRHQRAEAFELGRRVLERRRAEGFPRG